MRIRLRSELTAGMSARMLADVIMINVALVVALAMRFSVTFLIHSHSTVVDYEREFSTYVEAYWHNAPVLTVICLAVFGFCGFYTYGRSYQGRYKAVVISQAVVQSYLIFGFLTYFLWDGLSLTQVPRSAVVLSFLFNLGLCLGSRTWTFLWERVIRPDREVRLRGNGAVRNVLVIGGAGYIGSALLPKLLEQGYRVRVLDLFLYGSDPIANVANHPRLELIRGDFRHVDQIVRAMRGMDAVVHLGAIVGDPACDLDETVTINVNLGATQMIAQVAKATGIRRFVFASTCSVYGANDDILDERSEVKPISLYGQTKLAAERGLQSMADANFTPTILRFGTIYGLSGRTRFDLVVNLLAAKGKIDGQITVFGGSQWRPFVHVDDAALGVFKALETPLAIAGNQIFNVGSDEQNRTIRQIGELIHEQLPAADLIVEENDVDKRNYRVSFAKIRNQLGFEPSWTLENGIRQVVEAVASGDVQDYRDAKYSNVKFLSESGAIEIISVDDDWSRELNESRTSPQYAT